CCGAVVALCLVCHLASLVTCDFGARPRRHPATMAVTLALLAPGPGLGEVRHPTHTFASVRCVQPFHGYSRRTRGVFARSAVGGRVAIGGGESERQCNPRIRTWRPALARSRQSCRATAGLGGRRGACICAMHLAVV